MLIYRFDMNSIKLIYKFYINLIKLTYKFDYANI